MALSKLDLAIATGVAAILLLIEHDHRVLIGTPASAEASSQAAVCPESDSVPFSPDCIAFIGGGVVPEGTHGRPSVTAGASAPQAAGHGRASTQASACPASNENAPYSADCIAFLSGRYWQAN